MHFTTIVIKISNRDLKLLPHPDIHSHDSSLLSQWIISCGQMDSALPPQMAKWNCRFDEIKVPEMEEGVWIILVGSM